MTQGRERHSDPPLRGENQGNGVGIAALILGVCAVVGALVPFVNYGSGFVAFVGIILGLVGLFRKDQAKGTAIAGITVSGIALVLSLVFAIAYTVGFVHMSVKQREDTVDEPLSLVYEVTGAATDATITYATFNGGKLGSEQQNSQALPFTKTILVEKGGNFSSTSYVLSATNGTSSMGDIVCRISVDGKIIANQTSSGAFATAVCSGSGQ